MPDTKTLYVSRRLENHHDFLTWAESQGFKEATPPEHLHVTIAYSKTPVAWDNFTPRKSSLWINGRLQGRSVAALGDKGAVVLKFSSEVLQNRWSEFCAGGCAWEWESYMPHVTITYNKGNLDISRVKPYQGDLLFGPEVFAEIDEEFVTKLQENKVTAEL